MQVLAVVPLGRQQQEEQEIFRQVAATGAFLLISELAVERISAILKVQLSDILTMDRELRMDPVEKVTNVASRVSDGLRWNGWIFTIQTKIKEQK